MNKAVYIAPEDQDEVDLGWMREALVMVSRATGEGIPQGGGKVVSGTGVHAGAYELPRRRAQDGCQSGSSSTCDT